MKVAAQIALWADQLRDLSAMGLHFAENIYQEERYRAVQELAIEMFALATGKSPEQLEPLRVPIFSHPTPFMVGDGAVIDGAGRILLIRRADNGCWAMPGGALEVGETPAAGVEREILEETGVHCRTISLVGVFDSRFCGTVSPHHLLHLVFLCAPLDEAELPPSHARETLGHDWFAEESLPADVDPGHISRIPEAFRLWRAGGAAFFDK
ncbi:MAG: NUDIX hydrolase N-terminal domain-containing protein [Anaerolineae bacterium]|nr:NUDIX hydrolase N-terminal domain-containing protein [Anaerolineae bacterium]